MATVSRRCTGARGGHKGAGDGSAGREEGGRGPGGSASSVERAVTAERLESPRVNLSRCECQKALFAAIAQNFGREDLHIMTACIRSAHESCGTRRITVDGADDDLRNALAIASDGVHRSQSGALSVASPASVSLQTRDKCGSGRLRLITDRTALRGLGCRAQKNLVSAPIQHPRRSPLRPQCTRHVAR